MVDVKQQEKNPVVFCFLVFSIGLWGGGEEDIRKERVRRKKIVVARGNYKGKKASNIKFQIAFGGREAVGREHSCGRSHWSFKCTGNVLYLKVGVRTRAPWCLRCVFMLCIYNMTFFLCMLHLIMWNSFAVLIIDL